METIALSNHRIAGPANHTFCIQDQDGQALLTIHQDGTVDGSVEDAGEAAAVFVREVRRLVNLRSTDL